MLVFGVPGQSPIDDLEQLRGKHIERVRKRAEKGLRSLIHKEYIRRVGIEMRTLKGSPHSRSTRMMEARRRTGILADEVYGLDLSTEAALMIGSPTDATRYLTATDDDTGGSIFGGLRLLRISAAAVSQVIIEANAGVKRSARLLRAEEAAEREGSPEGRSHAGDQTGDALRQLLAKRTRKRFVIKL